MTRDFRDMSVEQIAIEVEPKDPLAKSPVRQRGDCSITAYTNDCSLVFGIPKAAAWGFVQIRPRNCTIQLGKISQGSRRKAGLERSPSCRMGDSSQAPCPRS